MDILATIIWLLIPALAILNFSSTLKERRKLILDSDVSPDNVPLLLRQEVALQIKDGYRLISVEKGGVKLIKKKRYWFPFLLFLPMPNAINIILTSSFLCNVYGVELRLIGNNIEVSTF